MSSLSGQARAQAAASEPVEQRVELAEQKAALAFQAYQEQRYSEAVALYIEAFNAAPSADILYNVARIYDMKLGDRELAMTFYRRFIADPDAAPARIQTANERLLKLREAEFAAQQSEPAPAPGTTVAPATPPAPMEQRASEPARWTPTERTGAIIGALGVVGLGVGVGFGLAAMSQADTVKDLCDGNACRDQSGVDAAESAKNKALISTIGFVAGGTLLATGAALLIWGGGEPARERSSGFACEPQLAGAAASLACSGVF
jgi:tetratricopeptide (TPR) repeat protein